MKKNIITKGTKLLLLISTVIAFTTMPLIANAGTKKMIYKYGLLMKAN